MDTKDKLIFVRICQECHHIQKSKDPATYKDPQGKEPWRDTLCNKCKSESLDYGSYVTVEWFEKRKKKINEK